MVAKAMLEKSPHVKVTVIELSEDVIELVGAHLKEQYGDRLEIIEADVMLWKPPKGAKYDVVWMDIWDTISEDNLDDMEVLNRRYARKAVWKGCWQQEGCRAQRDRIRSGRGWY
jgi:spermidine synthase